MVFSKTLPTVRAPWARRVMSCSSKYRQIKNLGPECKSRYMSRTTGAIIKSVKSQNQDDWRQLGFVTSTVRNSPSASMVSTSLSFWSPRLVSATLAYILHDIASIRKGMPLVRCFCPFPAWNMSVECITAQDNTHQ